MSHDIFISYSRRDLAAVKSVKEELESLGFSCWMDLDGVESGTPEFTEKLAAAIEDSTAVLFFLSDASQQSRWSLNELRVARDLEKHVVIVRFDDTPMFSKFKLEFGGTDIIDLRKPEQKAKLLRDLCMWTGRVSLSTEDGKSSSANPEALYRMALRYKVGDGVKQNLQQAAILFRSAAELGHLAAQNDYGVCLQNGQGVKKDCKKAVAWYQKAAEAGYASAQLNLGYCYDRGEGVVRSPSEAVKWYRESAEQGNAWAQCNLGLCYEIGSGVEENEDEARYWYELAAEQGDATAMKGLRRLSRHLVPSSVAFSPNSDSVWTKSEPRFSHSFGTDVSEELDCDISNDVFGGVSGAKFQGRIGNCRITSILGEGTYGKVYCGEDLETGDTRAFKRFSGFLPQKNRDRILQHLSKVYNALATIDPSSTVLALPKGIICASERDYASDGSIHVGDYIVEMDLAHGDALEKWEKEQKTSIADWPDAVFDVCGQIAAALDGMHGAGLVHRDVSPSNIIVMSRADGKLLVHLCDFDLTDFHKELRRPLPIVGTPGYIAPEILADISSPNPLADQYSLASVLYRLLAGHPPYEDVSSVRTQSDGTNGPQSYLAVKKGSVQWNLLHMKPKPVPVLDGRQNEALAKALSFSPFTRFLSCQQMIEAIRSGSSSANRGWLPRLFHS